MATEPASDGASPKMYTDEFLQSALSYAAKEWRVIPLHVPLFNDARECIGCSCEAWKRQEDPKFTCDLKTRGKHPRIKKWPKKASSDEDDIRRWWSKNFRGANVGVATGPDSFLLVDMDGEEGTQSLADREWPKTQTVKTGNGKHYHFKWPELSFELKNDVRILPGIDIRVKKGLTVMPPSLHYSGSRYEWEVSPDEAELAELPSWFIEILKAKALETLQKQKPASGEGASHADKREERGRLYVAKAHEDECHKVRTARKPTENRSGERNDTLNKAALKIGHYAPKWIDPEEVERELLKAALANGLDESEARATIKSGLSAGMTEPKDPELQDDAPGWHESNGSGQAEEEDVQLPPWAQLKLEQLTKATGKMVQIDPDTGDPVLGENGKPIMIAKRTLSPARTAKAITEVMELRISEADTGDKPKIWRYDGGIWRTDGEKEIITAIDAIIGDLSYDRGLREALRRIRSQSPTATFDGDPYLFPAQDGVIDLKTGLFREARPEDYLTFRYGAAYNVPGADYRHFLWFLASSLPDIRDCLTVLDIITAIALRIPFDIIVLLFGGGSNGKGILEKVILALFTISRATAIELEELKRSRFGPGALLGKDVWIVSEVEGVKDAMSVLKKVSTGEVIDSDVKYGSRVQGLPHLVPMLDCNIAFNPGDDSHGRKRRWGKLDFPYTFGDDEGMRPIDRHLKDVLRTPEILAGILKIIAARAPALIKARKIYQRKTSEEQEAEYKRQQYHLSYFCDECLSNTWPFGDEKEIPRELADYYDGKGRLKVDRAHAAYKEYCRLFNATTPADEAPFGKYIKERFAVESISTTEKKESYRYYPGIYLTKSPNTAYAEVKSTFNYSNYRTTTGQLQDWIGLNDIYRQKTTATTGELLSDVVKELELMYGFISSCQDEREIKWENYLKNAVVPVVAVVKKPEDDDLPPNSPVVNPVVGKSPVVEPSIERAASPGRGGESKKSILEPEGEPRTIKREIPTPGSDQRRNQKPASGGITSGPRLESSKTSVIFTPEEDTAIKWAYDSIKRQGRRPVPFALAEYIRAEKGLDIGPKRCQAWLEART